MPIYEFSCNKCGKIFEILQRSAGDKMKIVCADCGSKKVKRVMSIFGGRIRNTAAASSGCSSCTSSSCSSCH